MARKINNLKPFQNMLNNHRFSDFAFLVNKSVYHASRCVVAGASDVFEALVNGHFQESTVKQIEIKDIMRDESFYNTLSYIYGHNLDFRTIPEVVLCEMLHLSQMYNLQNLYETLKSDLNTLEYVHMGSAVQLINTASIHEIKHLYERIKTFIYENTKYILEHESFVNLSYEILLDLLKSSEFSDKEINIFNGVLMWIHENIQMEKDLIIMELLRQIRFSNISLVEYVQYKDKCITDTNNIIKVFSKYKKIIHDKNSGISTKPRVLPKNYSGIRVKFTVTKHSEEWDKCYFSPIYEVKNLKWKLIVNVDPKNEDISVLLDCKPKMKCEYWECLTEFSFKLNSKNTSYCTDEWVSYSEIFSLSESQHGNKNFANSNDFFTYCIDKEDSSFEIELQVKPHDPTFT